MKKSILTLLLVYTLTSCGILFPFPENKKYPTTTFYVKNNSSKTVNFQSTVLKRSTNGPYEVTIPFSVPPKDSVLARQAMFKKDGENPQKWFTQFIISPVDGIIIHDPNLAENWKKWMNDKNRPCYTFVIAE